MEHLAVRCDCTAFRDKEHVHCVSVHPSQRLQGDEDSHTHTPIAQYYMVTLTPKRPTSKD